MARRAGRLDTEANRTDALRGTVEFWATESLRAARGAYIDPGTGERIEPGQRLADADQESNLAVVRLRHYQRACRWHRCSTRRGPTTGGDRESAEAGRI
jgi:hypothetical protein